MKQQHLELLHCVECGDALTVAHRGEDGDDMQSAFLGCSECDAWYPAVNGVGVFFRRSVLDMYLTPHERRAIERMGYELEELVGFKCSEGDRHTHETVDKWKSHRDEYWAGGTWEDYLTSATDEGKKGSAYKPFFNESPGEY